jgi:hypothetical protein
MEQFLLALSLIFTSLSVTAHSSDDSKDHPPVTAKLSTHSFTRRPFPKPTPRKLEVLNKDYRSTSLLPTKFPGMLLEEPRSLSATIPSLVSKAAIPQKPLGPEPIRFRMQANKEHVRIGEEFEFVITAELLPILPSQLFFFEPQRSFSLKILMPNGFEQTGGNYTDYIGAELQTGGPTSVTYTLRGRFTQSTTNAAFTLLRGPKDASANSLFEKKQEYKVKINNLEINSGSMAREAAVSDTGCQFWLKPSEWWLVKPLRVLPHLLYLSRMLHPPMNIVLTVFCSVLILFLMLIGRMETCLYGAQNSRPAIENYLIK